MPWSKDRERIHRDAETAWREYRRREREEIEVRSFQHT